MLVLALIAKYLKDYFVIKKMFLPLRHEINERKRSSNSVKMARKKSS